MNKTVKIIDNETALLFLKEHKAYKEHIYISPCELWIGYYLDNLLVGCVGLKGNRVKGFYVVREFRKNGYGNELIEYLKNFFSTATAYATNDSVKIFENHGFKVHSKNKHGIYYLKREGE